MTTEEMKTFEHRFFQAWNEGKPEILDELYSPAFINHINGENLDAAKQGIIGVRAAFSDLHLTLDDQIAAGDKLVSRWTARGVHSGVFLGVPATGKHVEVNGIGISRFENGKIVEAWSLADFLGLLRQMGALP